MKFIVDNTLIVDNAQRLDVALRVLSSLCGLGQTVTDEAIAGLRAGVNESEANLPLDELAGRIIRREIDRDGARIVMDPKSWTQKRPFLRWWAALKMKESQCPEHVRATHQA
jgi:hypothetical protein